MAATKNLIFIHGDSSVLPEKILQIKKHFFPEGDLNKNWVELPPPLSKRKKEIDSKWFDAVDAEISYTSWDDSKKVIVLKDLVDTAEFLSFIFDEIQKIPTTNYLVLCDTNNVVKEGKSKTEKCDWEKALEYFKQNGKIVNLGNSLQTSSKESQVKYVIDGFAKNDKSISPETAEVLLEMIGYDRSFINSEIEKICLLVDGKNVSREDILSMAFPISQEYPVWLFYSAINSGSFTKIMDATSRLIENGFNYDFALVMALKQLRWHVICSSQIAKSGDIDLKRFEKQRDNKGIVERILKNKGMDPRIYNQLLSEEEKKEVKHENVPSYYAMKDIRVFVEDILPKFADKKDGDKSVMYKTIERYLAAFDGLWELRISSKDISDIVYSNTIRKISVLN